MRKIREVLRLSWGMGLGNRQIARSLQVSPGTISDMLRRARDAGLSWPLPEDMDDCALESRLYLHKLPEVPAGLRPQPDMGWIRRELRRKGVTLQLLWQEYKQQYPDGYQYSQFCERYRRWRESIDVVMRQVHRAGEKMFIDYAGQTIPVVDAATGTVRQAYLFVMVLGASNYTYAEATWSQDLESWIGAHCRGFEFFGGVSEILVPDNLPAAVTRPCRYEPGINATYQEMAAHYGTVVIPARVGKPRDKAKVENGVLQAERWILAVLRNQSFFGLGDLNGSIRKALDVLNHKPFQKLDGCRASLFESIDKPALKPLPATRYEFAEWRKARVNIDYHIEVDHNYYSVPYQLARQQVDVRLTAGTVEVLHKGKRVASHQRCYGKGHFSTVMEHRPASHQKYLEWTPSRIIHWAESSGPNTAEMVRIIMERRPHPEQGFRSCLGLFRLGRHYSPERLEAACGRALTLGAYSYRSVKSILENNLDLVSVEEHPVGPPIAHSNVRGADYFRQGGNN